MSIVDNETFKSCFCDGSCLKTGRCGGMFIGPGLIDYPKQETTTAPKPTKAEELRRKADLAQRDKRAKARAKYESIFSDIVESLEEKAKEGNYSIELTHIEFSTLTRDEFDGFIDYLTDLGFYVEEMMDINRVLLIDWQERIRVAPPTTEFIKQHRKEWD